jgi:SpoVK/Ycf46/Vps4 family AAA+-type ATPase
MSSERPKKRHRFLDYPPVKNLNELLRVGETGIYYNNIDMIALWNILPHLRRLQDFIGMEEIKMSIFRQIVYYLQGFHRRDKEGEYLHTCIVGPPGTGKTSIAHIIALIYRDLGILGDGTVKVIHRDDLVAGYVGQTAIKVKKLLSDCIGGVVFLDEAYAMGAKKEDEVDSFAKEAVDTLTSFLSEHKTDLCFIIAGYEDDIKRCFFSINKGLERRFPWTHKIEPYTPHQLSLIALKIIKDVQWATLVTSTELETIISANIDLFKNAGGDVETFISKCKIAHAVRAFVLPCEVKFILTKSDFEEGIKIVKENKKDETDNRYMNMYT